MANPKEIMHVTTDTFDQEVLESELPVVIDFWAPWCGPCRTIAPLLQDLSEQWSGRMKVVKLNVDEEPQIASAFGIRGIPTIAVMKGTEVVDLQVGFGGPQALGELFRKHAAAETELTATR